MRLKHLLSITPVILGLALPASAQLSPELASWPDGPEGFLLTDNEEKEWKTLDSDEEARDFIALFWAKRDPNLDTPQNEFKAEFDARVDYADREFGTDDHRGALTDRGRVLLLLGAPQGRERRAATETVSRMGSDTGALASGSDEVREDALLWAYDPAEVPVKVRGSRLLFVFYETKANTNDFVMDRSHQEMPRSLRTLAKVPEGLVLHPKLDEPPHESRVALATPELPWVDGEPSMPADAHLFFDHGVADVVHRPLWVHLELPADAPEVQRVVGRVLDQEGTELARVDREAEALDLDGTRVHHLTFPVDATGSFTVEVAAGNDDDAVAMARQTVEISEIPADGTWISPIWSGTRVTEDPGSLQGEAFVFGGRFHLVPSAQHRFPKGSELSYFFYAVRPGLGEDGLPVLEAEIQLKKEGQALGQPFATQLPSAEIMEGLWLVPSALDLSGLPETGSYSLEMRIVDTLTGTVEKRTIPLEVVEN